MMNEIQESDEILEPGTSTRRYSLLQYMPRVHYFIDFEQNNES